MYMKIKMPFQVIAKGMKAGCKREEVSSVCTTSHAMYQISFPVFLDNSFHPLEAHQRLGHHHLNLLLSQHGKLSKQTLDDKLPRLQLGVDGDVRHGSKVVFLPREGSHRRGGTASIHAAADWCRSCREYRG